MPAILSSRQRIALRLAWRFMAPYRWRMLGALVALLFTAAITLSLGQGIRLLVDQGFLTASPELLNRYILRESEINQEGKARRLWDIEEGKGI